MRDISQFVTISEKPQSETITQSKTQRFPVFCPVKQRKAACHHNLAARLEECWATLHKKRKRQRAQGAEIKGLHKIWLKTTVISSSCFNFCLDAPQAGKTVGTVVKAEKSFLAPSQNWDTTAPYSPSNPWVQINSIQSNITQLYDTLTTLQRHRKSPTLRVTWICTVFLWSHCQCKQSKRARRRCFNSEDRLSGGWETLFETLCGVQPSCGDASVFYQ